MTPRRAPEAVLVALAEAADAWYGETAEEQPGWCDESKAMFKAMHAYRAAVAPLRTRSEVDAEKLKVATSFFAGYQSEPMCRQNWERLCSEATADETEVDENGDPIPTMYKDCGKCRYPSAGVCCGDEWCIRHHCCGHGLGDT